MKYTKGILTKSQYLAFPSLLEYERKRIAVALHIKINPKMDVPIYMGFRMLSKDPPIPIVTEPARGPIIMGLYRESVYNNASPVTVFMTRAAEDMPYSKTVKPPALFLFSLNQLKKRYASSPIVTAAVV